MINYPFHEEANVIVNAVPERLFSYLDDQASLGAHMEKPSMMMMGGRMTYELDHAKGRVVGSVIKMGGSFLGINLHVHEIITARDPPRRKVWETHGPQRILIIEAYRMGFEIEPAGQQSALRVFINHRRMTGISGRILGALFAGIYARWCVNRMAQDAKRHFENLVEAHA